MRITVRPATKVFFYSLAPGWIVEGYYCDDPLIIYRLAIYPADEYEKPAPVKGIHSALIREAFPIGRIKAEIAAATAWNTENIHMARSLTRKLALRTHPRRLSDDFLKRVAEAWLVEAHRGSGAYKRMLAHFEGEASSQETIRGWLKRARAEGWLAPSQGPGQLIAIPGPRMTD